MRVRRAFPLLLLPLAAAVQCGQRHALDRRVALGWFAAPAAACAAPAAARAAPAPAARPLTFTTSPSGLGAADIKLGQGELAAEAGSRVTFHVKGRLIGKNAWVFIDTQEEQEPLRCAMGQGQMIDGLEEGLLGMRAGGRRRLVVPSAIGYRDRAHEPKPRTFGQQQRLYGTVLNEVRRRQERESAELGGNDIAGAVVLDVQMVNVRTPA
jgi:hypothetical protein